MGSIEGKSIRDRTKPEVMSRLEKIIKEGGYDESSPGAVRETNDKVRTTREKINHPLHPPAPIEPTIASDLNIGQGTAN